MPAAKILPTYPGLPTYADPFRATETALTFWAEYWKASAEAAAWWTDRWMKAPAAFAAWTPAFKALEPRPIATVIDLAQAAAARIAADTAETTVALTETLAEVPQAMAADAASVAQTAAVAVSLEANDLTRLVGIGPKLAAALGERGVTRFEQIAAWTENDLAEVDKALDLKGRAVRDAWVAQAKRFAAEG